MLIPVPSLLLEPPTGQPPAPSPGRLAMAVPASSASSRRAPNAVLAPQPRDPQKLRQDTVAPHHRDMRVTPVVTQDAPQDGAQNLDFGRRLGARVTQRALLDELLSMHLHLSAWRLDPVRCRVVQWLPFVLTRRVNGLRLVCLAHPAQYPPLREQGAPSNCRIMVCQPMGVENPATRLRSRGT
jgi:hypothetical protein